MGVGERHVRYLADLDWGPISQAHSAVVMGTWDIIYFNWVKCKPFFTGPCVPAAGPLLFLDRPGAAGIK